MWEEGAPSAHGDEPLEPLAGVEGERRNFEQSGRVRFGRPRGGVGGAAVSVGWACQEAESAAVEGFEAFRLVRGFAHEAASFFCAGGGAKGRAILRPQRRRSRRQWKGSTFRVGWAEAADGDQKKGPAPLAEREPGAAYSVAAVKIHS